LWLTRSQSNNCVTFRFGRATQAAAILRVRSRSNIVRHGFGNKSKINTVRKGIGMHNFENQTAHQITNGSSPSRVLGRRAFLGRMAAGAALLAPGAALMAAGKAKGRPNLDKGDA